MSDLTLLHNKRSSYFQFSEITLPLINLYLDDIETYKDAKTRQIMVMDKLKMLMMGLNVALQSELNDKQRTYLHELDLAQQQKLISDSVLDQKRKTAIDEHRDQQQKVNQTFTRLMSVLHSLVRPVRNKANVKKLVPVGAAAAAAAAPHPIGDNLHVSDDEGVEEEEEEEDQPPLATSVAVQKVPHQ
jgi:hypothetical protein